MIELLWMAVGLVVILTWCWWMESKRHQETRLEREYYWGQLQEVRKECAQLHDRLNLIREAFGETPTVEREGQ